MSPIIFYLICFILIIVLLYFLTWFWPPDSPWSFWWTTDKKASLAIIRLAEIIKDDIVYELGSGDGEFVITVAKKVGARCVGIEIDPFRYYWSKARMIFDRKTQKKVTLIKKNFFDVKLTSATVVYVYLVPRALKKLLPKLKKELKPGTRFVSYRYEVNLPLIAENKKHKLYLYEF